ncbi:LTA synthase family protein [Priestia filamentosa]|uniref:LTA synthase family protein n=1 Tax=Priestia filamentosa TaxID=1402861 RepID=UPI0002ED8ED6|nr:LTA synthase family protein [Priestia filamentosa]MDT3763799.1 LTA synthase family protein [Priestia filamentosa]OXS71716.1 glycerol phosphate lipoteichoic acid synthase [Priestia filamentosa]WCM14447.1 LTA synthase family protein [Priestia filamentosa]WRU94220.1 LTA synthase family protein [Priestia filamentosa]SMF12615.1 lipoteichoic acid synthase [Priestia filamentosa]
MKSFFRKGQQFLNTHLGLFLFIAVLFWLKTYAAYQLEFDLGIDNSMQKFLLFINPISSSLFFLGIALFFKGKAQYRVLIAINFVLTFILFANIVFYRFFNDFITIPVLRQTENFGKLGGSAQALMQPTDILYFTDTIILIALVLFKVVKPHTEKFSRRGIVAVFTAAVMIFAGNLALAESDRPQLLTRAFDRNYLVKYLGAYNYTIYDAIQSTKSSAQRALADSSDVTEVENFTKASYAEPNPEYFGQLKGKNVIYVSLESLQSFMIGYKLNGQEVTPFLNSLAKDSNTLYFKNLFHQTGQGKTSDAEFMMENSIYPLPQGSVFSTKAENTYQALPQLLKENGYKDTAVFHGNNKTFWNREENYKAFGYDHFFDESYYNMVDGHVLNYGLEDKPYFKESMPYLESLKQPFYTKFITLSNHFPYPLGDDKKTIAPGDTGDSSVDNYFQTARYMDEALEQFFNDLKESGLYENSVIVMYGDHYGISENHKKAMSKVMGKDINDFEETQLQRVPLFIHAPGLEGKGGVKDTYGGQVDVRPTVEHLLGVDTKNQIQFGTDLLSKDHQQIVPFRNGDFVTPEYTQVDDKVYDNATGEKIPSTDETKKDQELVQKKLELSDKLVYGDLLRFYDLKGFEQPKRSSFDYSKDDKLAQEPGFLEEEKKTLEQEKQEKEAEYKAKGYGLEASEEQAKDGADFEPAAAGSELQGTETPQTKTQESETQESEAK